MKPATLLAIATMLVTPCLAQEPDHAGPSILRLPSASAVATPGGLPESHNAADFIANLEPALAKESEYSNRVSWIGANFITTDTDWLSAKVGAELSLVAVARAKKAATFDQVQVDPVTRRKLELVKRNLLFAPPDRPGAADELSSIGVRMASRYSTAKIIYRGKQLALEEIEEAFRTSRDPAELKALWESWHDTAKPMRDDFARQAVLANEGARALGWQDTSELWRSSYDMSPDEFSATIDRLMSQLAPMYANLHCYTRAKLNDAYGEEVQPRTGPIRADLLGNIWGQTWDNIFNLLAPKTSIRRYDLTSVLVKQGYDALKLVKTAENFYVSIGFLPLPATFWERSLLTRPRDREVDCHASAWDIDDMDDLRVKACLRVTAADFYVAHHELGHNVYQRAYKDQPFLFKGGANDGFHEAIGDFIGLNALTPDYLRQIGLIDNVPGPEADLRYLLQMALEKVPLLPFAFVMDKWRWQVFSGETLPDHYNRSWSDLRLKYQGIANPGPRPVDAFDPGAKFHMASNTPYIRYFLANIYQFQFYRAACRQAGWTGPLNRCSIYGNREVGERFQAMLRMGVSRPWPEALAAFTGERDIDASAVADYFAPLNKWLIEQNKGETCGW
ncbi:MAG: M2 family metallopeptidase [Xanthobacteraceae bacterium]